jgi:hypothetical protein
MGSKKVDFVVVPEHQMAYLKEVCSAASRAASKAQESANVARSELAEAVASGPRPSQLQHVWRLHREAVQKMNIVLFFGQLYVSAFRRNAPQGPSLAWNGR